MKVLFIGPLPEPLTGHSLACKVFLDEIRSKHEVHVVNLSKKGFSNGIDSIRRLIDVVKILNQIRKLSKKVDVVYFTISESYSGNIKDLLIYLLCFKKLSKMVVHLHGGTIGKMIFSKSRILFRVNKFFIQRLGAVIVLGKVHVSIFTDMIESQRIHIIPNFAEDFLFCDDEVIKSKFQDLTKLRVLFLSNLIHGKGYNELVRAYSQSNAALKESICIDFAGGFESASQKERFLKSIAGDIGMKYQGLVKGVRKKELLHSAHVFCLPTSLNEGQPISIIEAYASGCVVVTTGKGGIPDIFVDEVNGFMVVPQSTDSLCNVFKHLVDNKEKLAKMAFTNRQLADENYRVSLYNQSLVLLLDNVYKS
ncbi:glycosyltransferase family 4 protein [Arcticibacter tournemirensis]|uniref:Glycosyltransferase n=1 Tax=Arcticibacter tournemirensis TaxID=699437 RepID=A0A4V1KI16_9SPHI|nr:glycosyltransferase family 4 protein [Arcticibacter tournemirensis]RXF69122.1 glycosyltransferase [Arcticibacter tournemirensis]